LIKSHNLSKVLGYKSGGRNILPQVKKTQKKKKSSMVVHTCKPSYPRGRSKKIMVQDQPKQKCEIISIKQTKAKRAGDVCSRVLARVMSWVQNPVLQKKKQNKTKQRTDNTKRYPTSLIIREMQIKTTRRHWWNCYKSTRIV
jgi:hypothetical protein